jgi:hypothetical protein
MFHHDWCNQNFCPNRLEIDPLNHGTIKPAKLVNFQSSANILEAFCLTGAVFSSRIHALYLSVHEKIPGNREVDPQPQRWG